LLQGITFAAQNRNILPKAFEPLHIIQGLALAAPPGTLKIQLKDTHQGTKMLQNREYEVTKACRNITETLLKILP
jgi:hypothetical protein